MEGEEESALLSDLRGSAANTFHTSIFQSLSERERSSLMLEISKDDRGQLLQEEFVSNNFSVDGPSFGQFIAVHRTPKNIHINSCLYSPQETYKEVCEEENQFVAMSNDVQSLIEPVPLTWNEHFENEQEFYQEWRARCVCRILSTEVSNKALPRDLDAEISPELSLSYPGISQYPSIALPSSICHKFLDTPSFSPLLHKLVRYATTNETDNAEWIVYHPAFVPPLKVVQQEEVDFVLTDFVEHTLESLLKFSSGMFEKDYVVLFTIYQLVRALHFAHQQGMIHGNLSPASILSSNKLWLSMTGFKFPREPIYLSSEEAAHLHMDGQSGRLFSLWHSGEVSNFDYIMGLNSMAKRRNGDPNFCPVFPWVTDFTSAKGKLRDLTKTKYRLAKGDEQLDYMYASDHPHHLTDCLSELTYYNYKARVTPVETLKRYVRSKYEPKEFPASMERLYQWTPDECIQEFYTDPGIFKSIHADMPDLQIPSWCSSAEDFIHQHRDILESPEVSSQLHHWIDLTFGYKLTGDAAIAAKNVALINDNTPRSHGFVQLFTIPHPPKVIGMEIDSSQEDSLIPSPLTSKAKRIRTLSALHSSSEIKEGEQPRVSTVAYEEILKFKNIFKHNVACYRAPKAITEDPIFLSKFEEVRAGDIFSLGCIIAEIYMGAPIFNTTTIFQYQLREFSPSLFKVPGYLLSIVESMVDMRASNRLPLVDVLNSAVFPSYFEEVYAFLVAFVSYDSLLEQFDFVKENLSFIRNLHSGGFDLLLPFLLPFLESEDTQCQCGPLIEPFINQLGVYRSKKILQPYIVTLFEIESLELKTFLYENDCLSLLQRTLGLEFLLSLLPYLFTEISSPPTKTANIAVATIKSLGNRLPLTLTVQKIIHPLLDQLKKEDNQHTVALLLYFLKRLGPHVIENHYIPRIMTLIQTHSTKSTKGEAVVLVALNMIEGLLAHLPSKAVLKGFVIDSSQLMVLLLNASTSDVLYTLIGTLVKIAHHIGPEATTEQLVPYLDQFFNQYAHVHPEDPSSVQEIYTPHMAAMLYYQFAILIGKGRLDSEITNVQQIQSVMQKDARLNMYYENLSNDDFVPVQTTKGKTPKETPQLMSKLEQILEGPNKEESPGRPKTATDPLWLIKRLYETDESTPSKWNSTVYHCQKAHTAVLKSIDVNSFESSILTASYDGTVKLWSLDSTLRQKFTYQRHNTPVHSVSFISKGNMIASCGKTLHIWDPATQQKTLNISHPYFFRGAECIDQGNTLAMSTQSNRFCIADTVAGGIVNDWVLPIQSIRGFKVSDDNNYVYVGSDTGLVTLLDLRTGNILNQWKGHDSAILKVDYFDNSIFTSSTDKTVCRWDMNGAEPSLSLKLKGYSEPPATFAELDGYLLSSCAHKVASIPLNNQGGMITVSPAKLHNTKHDRIIVMKALKFHQLFILGSEDGLIKICS